MSRCHDARCSFSCGNVKEREREIGYLSKIGAKWTRSNSDTRLLRVCVKKRRSKLSRERSAKFQSLPKEFHSISDFVKIFQFQVCSIDPPSLQHSVSYVYEIKLLDKFD